MGTNAETYAAIRGLDAFHKVCEGIRAAALHGVAPSLRVTLQRANYRELPAFVDLAKQIGARQISFLAVDIANPHAFGRSDDYATDLALRGEELAVFEQLLDALEREHAEDFAPVSLRKARRSSGASGNTLPLSMGGEPTLRCAATRPNFLP